MSPYITFRDENKEGVLTLYILQRDFPHYVATIADHPIINTLCCEAIAGHHLYLVFQGTLRGNFIPGFKNVSQEIQIVFEDMARWFYAERCLKDPKRYKKYLII